MSTLYVFRNGGFYGTGPDSWGALVNALGLERANKFSDRTSQGEYRINGSNGEMRSIIYARNQQPIGDFTRI